MDKNEMSFHGLPFKQLPFILNCAPKYQNYFQAIQYFFINYLIN